MREVLLPASNGMRTISQVVEEVIGRSPFLAEAIAEGVANNAKIARRIKPEVEKRLLEEVSEASISMALHRLSKDLGRSQFGHTFLKHISDITVRGNLVQFVCANSSDVTDALEAISRRVGRTKDAFFNYSRGLHETVIIVNGELGKEVGNILGKHVELKRTEGLSAITMHLPEGSLNVPGVYYPVLKAIALEGLSLVEVMSVRTEFSIIFKDENIDRAFSVIKKITS